jgi:hypothetical protein
MKTFWRFLSYVMGRNTERTPASVIKEQLNEKRPLPLGRTEFETWSDRIISGACIPGATHESIKFVLADQLLHLGPTVDCETDLYFIKCLRKFAVNQVADTMRREIRDIAKARMEAEQTKPAEVTALPTGVTDAKEVLSNGRV